VATLKVHDLGHEFRIEIIGRFSGQSISEAANEWKRALGEASPRRITVDINRLSGYDTEGRKLLSDMQRHGTMFAAGTPQSLVFLNEITDTPHQRPALVVDSPISRKPSITESAGTRAYAAGK